MCCRYVRYTGGGGKTASAGPSVYDCTIPQRHRHMEP